MIVIGFTAGWAAIVSASAVDMTCVDRGGVFGSAEMGRVAEVVVLLTQVIWDHHHGPRLRMKMIQEIANQPIAKPAVAGQTTILASW